MFKPDPPARRPAAAGRPRRPLAGFTLVELLVVISIIALLIALLLPALQQARHVARELGCQTNLRSAAIGLFQYQEDYQGFYPPRQDVTATVKVKGVTRYRDWSNYFLTPYLGASIDALRCPADTEIPEYRASYA
ncbi:MAG: type II secretion system protein, partial [Planctomycetota bacterium]